jgi:MFS-type transporter involved in bile tolerance (Atg22 family)
MLPMEIVVVLAKQSVDSSGLGLTGPCSRLSYWPVRRCLYQHVHKVTYDAHSSTSLPLVDGISFALQAFLFLVLGTFADFGKWRPYILIVATVITIAVSFAWLGVTDPSQWQTGIGLYIVGLVGYQTSLTFWTAAFPGLARNLPEVRESKEKLEMTPPETTPEEHHLLDVLTRNRVANVSMSLVISELLLC